MTDFSQLPDGLPIPRDDGAANHLPGLPAPQLTLPSTSGQRVTLDRLGPGRTIIYVYPLTGRPGTGLPIGWDEIPGARGCTTEACDFGDHYAELLDAGASRVFGLSSQDTAYQRELTERLRLPFEMLSDTELRLVDKLRLLMPLPPIGPACSSNSSMKATSMSAGMSAFTVRATPARFFDSQRSGLLDQAELLQNGHSVVETNLLGDEVRERGRPASERIALSHSELASGPEHPAGLRTPRPDEQLTDVRQRDRLRMIFDQRSDLVEHAGPTVGV